MKLHRFPFLYLFYILYIFLIKNFKLIKKFLLRMEDKKESVMDLAELKKSMIGKAVIKVNILNN